MQQFMCLFNKEWICYFKNPLAFGVLFVYLFISVGVAFYFGSYLAMHDASLYALFYAQPIILMAVIPALTMKLWAEEYRSGTAEFLLTQPVSFYKIVVAKFLAAWSFCCLMSLFLLPFVFYSSSWLLIDWGSIFTSFCGLWLLMATFCTLGAMVSAFNRNLVLSYLTSIFILALYVSLPFSFLYYTYNNFLFAEIGFADVLYFLSLTVVFSIINLTAVEVKISAKKHKNWRFALFVALLMLGTILLNVFFYNFLNSKMDFTSAKLYSLKSKSSEVISLFEKPINIDLYVARNYVSKNADYFHYLQQVERFLKKFEKASDGVISVNVIYVEPFSELETKVIESGLYFEENSSGTRDYFGAILRDVDGNEEVIKQFLLERKMFLEKDLNVALLKLLQPERKKNLAVFMDPKQNIESFEGFLLALENDYNVHNVNNFIYEFSDNVDLVILLNPKELSPYLMYAVDQYLMRGGKLIIFFDFYTKNQSEVTNEEDLSIVKFLNMWKINLKPMMVDDGVVNKDFAKISAPLVLYKAVPFEVLDKDFKVTPLIEGKDGLSGVLLEGTVFSLYQKNPFDKTQLQDDTAQFLPVSVLTPKIALVSDVDVIDDENWVNKASPDINPFSVIEDSGNVQFAKALVDFMVGNDLFLNLPLNDKLVNRNSIGQMIEKRVFEKYKDDVLDLQQNIRMNKATLLKDSQGNWDKMNELLQVSEAGMNIAQQEENLQSLEYKMKGDYNAIVRKMALWFILFIPLMVVGGALIFLYFYKLRQKAKIKEMLSE